MLTPTLLQMFFLTRRVMMALVGAGSVLVGGALLWLWFNPERAAGVDTLPLLGLLGLFALPACALALVRRDRRMRIERGALRATPAPGAAAEAAAPLALRPGAAQGRRAVA